MVEVVGHASLADLEQGYVSSPDVTVARHFQTIWLLAKGHSVAEVSSVTGFGSRWIEALVARYNAVGAKALGDLRRGNGAKPKILKPEVLERLRQRLAEPPVDGGVWTSRKVAVWLAGELGLASVGVQRGWEALRALGWSIQKPRPRNPRAATAAEAAAFKKSARASR